MSLKEAFAHHRYLFRQMEKVRPSFCVFFVLVAATSGLAGFISNVYLLRFAMNGVQQRLPFWQIALAFGLWLVIDLFIKSMRYAYQVWRIPLMVHDMHHYFLGFDLKNTDVKSLIRDVTDTYEGLIRLGITCIANGALLLSMDPFLAAFALIPLCALPLRTLQRRGHSSLQRETDRLHAESEAAPNVWQYYQSRWHYYRRQLRCHGRKLATLGYVIALLTEILLEIGGMLYAVYRTVQGDLGYGDCLVAVTAIGSLSHALLHLPEQFAAIRQHGVAAAHFRLRVGRCEE